ncbi:MAG TPA: NAD(P)H-dependent oxidoreductase, partial [Dongiaceae bacterium]
ADAACRRLPRPVGRRRLLRHRNSGIHHSYPASLKHAIDQGDVEWLAKPAAFGCYGGASGGVRAIEHLRHVFAELRAATNRHYVCFHMARLQFNP